MGVTIHQSLVCLAFDCECTSAGAGSVVFDRLAVEALAGHDRIVGLDLSRGAIDGSIHKAFCGGEGTGNSLVDRAIIGWKWPVAVEATGISIGIAIDGANRNHIRLLDPIIDAIAVNGLIDDIELLSLDRGYDYPVVRERLARYGLSDRRTSAAQ